ncbi:MAG TPA: hypothetical protein VFQ43_08390, partial [Nitrososphaera sp.]|nr:hypothetical protein [Nitrososphaera sp.]
EEFSGCGSSNVLARSVAMKNSEAIRAGITSGPPQLLINTPGDLISVLVFFPNRKLIGSPSLNSRSLSEIED